MHLCDTSTTLKPALWSYYHRQLLCRLFLPSTYMEQVVLCNGEEPTVERIIYQCLWEERPSHVQSSFSISFDVMETFPICPTIESISHCQLVRQWECKSTEAFFTQVFSVLNCFEYWLHDKHLSVEGLICIKCSLEMGSCNSLVNFKNTSVSPIVILF